MLERPKSNGLYIVKLYISAQMDPIGMIPMDSEILICLGKYDKNKDEWEFVNFENNFSIKGMKTTEHFAGSMSDNIEIISYEKIKENSIIIEDYVASDGMKFREPELMEYYNEHLELSNRVGKFELTSGGYNIQSKEDFDLLKRYLNLCQPYYNPETNEYEIIDNYKGDYTVKGIYHVKNNLISLDY